MNAITNFINSCKPYENERFAQELKNKIQIEGNLLLDKFQQNNLYMLCESYLHHDSYLQELENSCKTLQEFFVKIFDYLYEYEILPKYWEDKFHFSKEVIQRLEEVDK